MNNSILDIENTLLTGDYLSYLMGKAKDDSSHYAQQNFNGINWMYQRYSREQLDKIFIHAPEGFTEFLVDNGYIYSSKFSKSYFLKTKLRKIISVNH